MGWSFMSLSLTLNGHWSINIEGFFVCLFVFFFFLRVGEEIMFYLLVVLGYISRKGSVQVFG